MNIGTRHRPSSPARPLSLKVYYLQRERACRRADLYRLPFDDREDGSQCIVASNYLVEALLQGRNVELTF
jgi:hypothetical protein